MPASPGARYRIGAYRFWHRHVAILLAAATPEADSDALAHAVLAPLAAEHLHAVVEEQEADASVTPCSPSSPGCRAGGYGFVTRGSRAPVQDVGVT
ncbi:MAG: hypothetical protein ACODAF_01730 [Actinomycetota bacterium]